MIWYYIQRIPDGKDNANYLETRWAQEHNVLRLYDHLVINRKLEFGFVCTLSVGEATSRCSKPFKETKVP